MFHNRYDWHSLALPDRVGTSANNSGAGRYRVNGKNLLFLRGLLIAIGTNQQFKEKIGLL